MLNSSLSSPECNSFTSKNNQYTAFKFYKLFSMRFIKNLIIQIIIYNLKNSHFFKNISMSPSH